VAAVTHVPLIFAGAGGASRPGQARTQAVSHLDIFPTLIDLCGLPKRSDLDGVSLVPQLKDAAAKRRPAVITFMKGNHAIRDERFRYIRYADGSEELYDCVADPNEWKNVAADPAMELVKRRLAEFVPKTNADPVPDRDGFDFDFATYTYRKRG
jgi:arylsulfatase A-like enzyme